MNEFELKLEVPPERAAELERTLAQEGAGRRKLRAIYFDTGQHDLRSHGLSMRLRLEGDRWLQTTKADTRETLNRLEHNVRLDHPADGAVPDVDVLRHQGTAVGRLLARALRSRGGDGRLIPVFEVEVERMTLVADTRHATVELAFDQGRIQAGSHSRPICELEFELLSGRPAEVLGLARRWCSSHGLWLNTASKSEKGHRLADGMLFGPPVLGQPPRYKSSAKPRKVAAEVLAACLDHVVGNACEVASGSNSAEHVHQLRVGIRRLRTAMQELEPIRAECLGGWETALVQAFRALGEHRDRNHVVRTLEPRIEAAGGPVLAARQIGQVAPEPMELVRAPAFQDALLGLLCLAHERTRGREKSGRSLRKSVRGGLRKLHSRAVSEGKRFLDLDEASQHRVRKRLKRLRYLSELAAPMFGEKKARSYVRKLKPAQEALGSYNDEVIALQTYRQLAKDDPRALFGVGWLSAQREADAHSCARTLRKLSKVKPYWK